MRVIAGKLKSRRLATLRGRALRPTSDRLRETLFNILGAAVEDCLFVDLYAGSGAVGIEALSRGARRAIFVEKHAAAVALIEKNLRTLGLREDAEVLAKDAAQALSAAEARAAALETERVIVFLDPPYAAAEEYERVLARLECSPLLARDTLVVAEHTRRQSLPERIGRLARTRAVTQGDAALSFYRKSTAMEA